MVNHIGSQAVNVQLTKQEQECIDILQSSQLPPDKISAAVETCLGDITNFWKIYVGPAHDEYSSKKEHDEFLKMHRASSDTPIAGRNIVAYPDDTIWKKVDAVACIARPYRASFKVAGIEVGTTEAPRAQVLQAARLFVTTLYGIIEKDLYNSTNTEKTMLMDKLFAVHRDQNSYDNVKRLNMFTGFLKNIQLVAGKALPNPKESAAAPAATAASATAAAK